MGPVLAEEFDDCQDLLESLMSNRGWAVRHGHRKKLQHPKRGKAAMKAELQGQGKEVLRGRSCFKKRQSGGTTKNTRNLYATINRKQQKRNLWNHFALEDQRVFKEFQEICFSVNDDYEEYDEQYPTLVDGCFELKLSEVEKPDDASTTLSELSGDRKMEYDSEDCDTELSVLEFETLDSTQTFVSALTALRVANQVCRKSFKASRWELAVARAENAIKLYIPPTSAIIPCLPSRKALNRMEQKAWREQQFREQKQREHAWKLMKSSRRPRRSQNKEVHVALNQSVNTCQLIDNHQALVKKGTSPDKLQQSTSDTFSAFQKGFLQAHGQTICSKLRDLLKVSTSGLHGNWAPRHAPSTRIELNPATLPLKLQLRFLKACAQLGGAVIPVFHGTKPYNIYSIFNDGLLIPGNGNKLKVANGSAHGLGIYTANMDYASLSYGFGGRKGMLICGVLDNATQLEAPLNCGTRKIVAESSDVRHVGGAIVVFNERRVVPLFHAQLPKNKRPQRYIVKQQTQTKKKKRTAKVAKHKSDMLVPAFALRRAARRRRMCGLGRCGVGAPGL